MTDAQPDEVPRVLDLNEVRPGQFVHIEETGDATFGETEHYLGEILPAPDRHIFIDDLIRDEGSQALPAYPGLTVTLIKDTTT